MSTNTSTPAGRRKWLWPALAVVVLLVWTVYCELNWKPYAPHLRAVPAFFFGVLLLLFLNLVVRLCVGVWRNGWRWLVGRELWRLFGWTAVFALSTIVLFYNVELWRGKRAWAAVVREAKVRGETLDYESLFPPPPPEEQNFARAPLFAPFFQPRDPATGGASLQIPELEEFSGWHFKAPQLAPWREARKSDLRKLAAYYFKTNLPAGSGVSTNSWESVSDEQLAAEMLIAMEKYRPLLEEVRQFSNRSQCWFPRGSGLDGLMDSSFSRAMGGLLRLVRLRASAELAAKRPAAAFDDLKLGLRLAELGRQCPQPNSAVHVGYHAYVMDALQPLWEGLAERCWTAGQLAEMQSQLEKLDFLADYANAVRADALSMATLAERFIPTTDSKPPRNWLGDGKAERVLDFVRLIYPRGWSLQDQAALHRFHLQTTSRFLDLPARRIVGRWPGPRRSGLFTSSDLCFYIYFAPKASDFFVQASEGFPLVQTAVDQAALACALERYRLANGKFPATLDALVPKFVAQLPHDIVTGEPLKYRRMDGGGFILYSVGLNKVDDGGTPSVRNPGADFDLRRNDWVWLCPAATEAK